MVCLLHRPTTLDQGCITCECLFGFVVFWRFGLVQRVATFFGEKHPKQLLLIIKYAITIFITRPIWQQYSDFVDPQIQFYYMNYSTLTPVSYSTPLKDYSVEQQWQGQRSSRFARCIRFQPQKDLIRTNFDLPDQTPVRGRFHFNEPNSFEPPFRPCMHKVPPIQHWHLRDSKIRTMEFKPSEPLRRAQRVHNNEGHRNHEYLRPQSIRTFYGNNSRSDKQYSVQQKMQRKYRIDPVQMRKSFYQGVDVFRK